MGDDATGSGLGGASGAGAAGGATGAGATGGLTGTAGAAPNGGAAAFGRLVRGVLPAHGHETPSTGGVIDYLRTQWGSDHLAAADPHPAYATDADLADHLGAADPHAQYATDADLAAHGAAADPHPGYLTPPEGDARYAVLGATDPFPQYLTPAEADALFLTPAEGDGRYARTPLAVADLPPELLTEAEGDAAYAALDHTHAWPTAAREYNFSTSTVTGVDPGVGFLRTNTANLCTATVVTLDTITTNNFDIGIILRALQPGDIVFAQDKDNGANWVRWKLTTAPTDLSGWWRLDATIQAAAGAVTTAQLVAVVFYLEGGEGAAGSALTGDALWDAKGDLVAATGPDAAARVAVGANGTLLSADSAQAAGVAWVANPVTAHAALPNAHHAQAHDHTAADGSGVLTNEVHDGYSQYANLGADAAQPAANTIRLYSKDNGSGVATLYYRTEDGTIYELPTLATGGGNGSGAPANATYITTGAESKLSAERVLGSAVIMSGLLAGRPAFGTAGRLYLATDDDFVYRDTGSAWETFATRATGGAGSYLPLAGGTLTGAVTLQGASSTANVLQAKLAADTQPRFRADASGKLEWGAGGAAAPNVALSYGGAELRLAGDFFPATTNAQTLGNTSLVWSNAYAGALHVGTGTRATTGALRLTSGAVVAWRNAGNTANLSLTMDASDRLALAVGSGSLTTSATAGSASALPGVPAAYLTVVVNGTAYKLAAWT